MLRFAQHDMCDGVFFALLPLRLCAFASSVHMVHNVKL